MENIMIYLYIFLGWIVFTLIWLSNAAALHSLNYATKKEDSDYIKLERYYFFHMHIIQLIKIIIHCRKQGVGYFRTIEVGISRCFN